MATRRRYSKAEKVAAIVAADAASAVAASEQTGIPRTTIQYWLDQPEFVELRQNAREAMAEEARVVARLAWQQLGKAVQAGALEPRDLIMAAGMATDKSLLLSGEATARTESRTLTEGMDDHERATLRDIIDTALAAADAAPAGDPG